jgi:hypothetical protein
LLGLFCSLGSSNQINHKHAQEKSGITIS